MSKRAKRKRELPKPNASFFDSPPQSPPSSAGKKEPPDQRRLYLNSREPTDPEIMQTKIFWEAPEMILGRIKNINRGFIVALEYELIPSETESYTAEQIKEIQHIVADLISKPVKSGVELLQRVAQLTVSVSKDVRDGVSELAEQFAAIASGGTLELEEAKLRF